MNMKRIVSQSFRVLAALMLTAAPTVGTAAEKPEHVKYVPPDGFAGHAWGELRTSFTRLPEAPLGVGAAFMMPVEKQAVWHCIEMPPPSPIMNGYVPPCDYQKTLDTLHREYEGGGFYVLSEFSIEGQGFRYGDESDGVVLHPIVYQFCANWHETKREVPPKFDEINKFCGVKLMFQSDTREQLRKQPAEYVTNYDRVLERLLAKFGKPDNFVRRGQVVLETRRGRVRTGPTATSASGAGARRATAACIPPARPAWCCQSTWTRGWARCSIRHRCSGNSRTRARISATRAIVCSRCCTPASR